MAPEGAETLAEVTSELFGEPVAMVYDGRILAAPRIREVIRSGALQIAGGLDAQEAARMAVLIDAGEMPVELTIESADEVAGDPQADQSLCPQLQE